MLLERAKKLQNTYSWNILPLGQFVRNGNKKEIEFIYDFKDYRDKHASLELFEDSRAQHLMILTGKISDLTIIDLDSSEAVEVLEELTNEPIYNLSNYIIKTVKGFQLFYRYNPKLKSVTKYKGFGIDILNDNYQTFADPINPGYSVLKEEEPGDIPEKLIPFFSDFKRINTTSEALYNKKKNYYVEPFVETIEEFINAARISKKLKLKLENKFCSFQFADTKLEDYGKGNRSSFLSSIAAKLSLDPTISKEAFESFMIKFNNEFTKMNEIEFHRRFISRYLTKQASMVDVQTGEYTPFWSYNNDWEKEHEKYTSETVLPSPDWSVWADIKENKYALYHVPSDSYTLASKPMLVDRLKGMFPENYESGVATHLFPSIENTFDPLKPHPFFKDEYGREYYNTFKRTSMMQYFLECEPSNELPEFINNVLNNIYPEKELKDKFLHDIAHHLRYLKYCSNAMITIGKIGGEGKGIIFNDLLKLIYEEYYIKVGSNTFISEFNGELKNKLFVYLDESEGKFNDALLRGLKTIISNATIPLREMRKQVENINNYIMLGISSNKSVPVQLDSDKDRRFNVSQALKKNLKEYEWFNEVQSTIGVDKKIEQEIRQFIEYLAGLETSDVMYSHIIENESRNNLKNESKSTLEYTIELLAQKKYDELEFFLDDILIEQLHDTNKIKVRDLIEALSNIKVNANRKIKPITSEYNNLELKLIKNGKIKSQYLIIS